MKSRLSLPVCLCGITLLLFLCQSAALQGQTGTEKVYGDKILSGKLYHQIKMSDKELTQKGLETSPRKVNVIMYFNEYPSAEQLKDMATLQVTCYKETWTPPAENHPYGFLVASVPAGKLPRVLALPFIKKMDTAERTSRSLNNSATRCVRAPMLWEKGIKGKGVKVGVLDSGIDITYAGTDLPATFQVKDYSAFPDLDDDVANTVTGHGTHVAATVLGRGLLSVGQNDVNNGKGAFMGCAPAADLVFLKIGKDSNASADDACLIAAIDAAVNIYHVDVLNLSYGGWDTYHDGSSATEQKVDWAYDQGVPFFCSAGNSSNDRKHVSWTLDPGETCGLIEVDVTGAKTEDTKLRFNLVWANGTSANDMTLNYFNSARDSLPGIIHLPGTMSIRGTASQYSETGDFLPSGDGLYYLTVTNLSENSLTFHIYEDWSNQEDMPDNVRFKNGNEDYTIGSPSSADHAFSVGAYVSRTTTSNLSGGWWWGSRYVYDGIALFSSQGPTLDERIKPDIAAPGHVLVSLRDKDVYRGQDNYWVDNDGLPGGDANYYMMRGTSMASPVAAGAAALYLELNPSATPEQVYSAFRTYSDKTGLNDLPNNIWGAGKLDINAASAGKPAAFIVDGNMGEDQYKTLATFTNRRNGAGNKDNIGAIKFYSDGVNLHVGVTGELSADNNILLFFDFSGVKGRGNDVLGGGSSDPFIFCSFAYMGNAIMDLDADFALGFNKGNSTMYEFFADAIRYGNKNLTSNIGKVNQRGASSDYDIGTTFGGKGDISFAFDTTFSKDPNRGVECTIPIAAFAGVDTTQTLRLFAVISSMYGVITNECIPGDPGSQNPGDGGDFSSIPSQDFFTQPVKISGPASSGVEIIAGRNGFSLEQNYPNPFKGTTTIQYSVPGTASAGSLSFAQGSQPVRLTVYDISGIEVMTLVNEVQPAGDYSLQLDGSRLNSGVYYYRLKAGNHIENRKMLVIK
jgi:subtilisin family serine protease